MTSSPRSLRDLLAPVQIALATACIAGAAELVITGLRRFVFHHMVYAGWPTLWMTPLSWALLLAPIGLALGVAAWLTRASFAPRVVLFVLSLMAAFFVGWLFFPALHRYAIIVLALGVAMQTTRALASRYDAVARTSVRVAWVGAALAALAGIIVHGGRALNERRMTLAPPSADPPSVLLIVLDAVRAQELGVYGFPRPTTPQLARLAAGGTRFAWAFSTAPWTTVSHASMFTGRDAHDLTVDWEVELDPSLPTLADVLRRRGWATGGFVGNVNHAGREVGLARGFAHFEDFLVSPAEIVMASSFGRFLVGNPRLRDAARYYDVPGRKTAEDVADAFLRWQHGLGARPFFAFLNIYDAHEPYLPPSPFDTAFGKPSDRNLSLIRLVDRRRAERIRKERMDERARRAEQDAYDGDIAAIDRAIGRMVDELRARGAANTLVIVTGDHGELFGEHGLFAHGNSLYLPLLHVPLIMSLPGTVAESVTVNDPVSLRDLAASVLALVAPEAQGEMPGHAFLTRSGLSHAPRPPIQAEVRPAPNQNPRYPASRGVLRSLIADGWHYVRGPGDSEELYNMATDTAEAHNVAADPAMAPVIARLRATLDSLDRSVR